MISIVSPVYMGENLVEELVCQLIETLDAMNEDYEIILVDDSSPDRSWEKIEGLCKVNNKIKGVKFSRNFGQHYAITAGIEQANGDWIVVMDCDLQDRPDQIPLLYEKALEGYDYVLAQRLSRQDRWFKRLSSKLFYKIFSYLTETKQDGSVANFGIYNKSVVHAVLQMKDQIRAFPILVQWVGFNCFRLPVTHSERLEGKSSYTFIKLLKLAFDVIIAFSEKPLLLTLKLGITISSLSFIVGLYYVISFLLNKISVPGYTSLIVSIWFLSGIIISLIGVIGIYLGKAFNQVKNRPLYISSKKINTTKNE